MSECEYSGRRCFLIAHGEGFEAKQCAEHMEPDGDAYIRCGYFSNRTRIRCGSVRPADAMKPYGFCEKHNGYIERVRQDALRARRLLDPGFAKENGNTLNYLNDEVDETLEDIGSNWPYIYESLYCDTRIDDPDNPLRNAGVFTMKEVILQYMDALERQKEALLGLRIIYAEKHRRLISEHAKSKQMKDMDNKCAKSLLDSKNSLALNEKLLAQYKAYKAYGSYSRWNRYVYFMEKVFKRNSAFEREEGSNVDSNNASFAVNDANNVKKKFTSESTDINANDRASASLSTGTSVTIIVPRKLESNDLLSSERVNLASQKLTATPGDVKLTDAILAKKTTTACQHVQHINCEKPKICSFDAGIKATNTSEKDEDIVCNLLERLVDYVDACTRPPVVEKRVCGAPRLPLSDFCTKHILSENKQVLYSKCIECEEPALPFLDYCRCRLHYEKLTFGSALDTSVSKGTQQSVTIGDDLDSDLYIKMCVDMAKTEQRQAKYQQQPNFVAVSQQRGTDLMNSNNMNIHNNQQQQIPHHLMQRHTTMAYASQHATHHHQHPQYHQQQYHRRQQQPHHGYMDSVTGYPGIKSSIVMQETETCARIRPFIGKQRAVRDRNLSASSSSSNAPLFSPLQLQSSSTILSPKPSSSQGGYSQISASQSHYSPSHSPADLLPTASVSMTSVDGGVTHRAQRHHSPPSSSMMPRRMPAQINNSQSSSFPYPIVQRRPPPVATAGMPTRPASSYVRVVRGGGHVVSGNSSVAGPPLTKISRRGGHGGAYNTANSATMRTTPQMQPQPVIYRSAEEYVQHQQQYEKQQQQKQHYQAYVHTPTRILSQPSRPQRQFVVGKTTLRGVERLPTAGPQVVREELVLTNDEDSGSMHPSGYQHQHNAIGANSPPPPLFTAENTIGRSIINPPSNANKLNANVTMSGNNSGRIGKTPISILPRRREPAQYQVVRQPSVVPSAAVPANCGVSAVPINNTSAHSVSAGVELASDLPQTIAQQSAPSANTVPLTASSSSASATIAPLKAVCSDPANDASRASSIVQ